MDFFPVPTATFRVLIVWFLIHHGRRKVVRFNVTENIHSGRVRRIALKGSACGRFALNAHPTSKEAARIRRSRPDNGSNSRPLHNRINGRPIMSNHR